MRATARTHLRTAAAPITHVWRRARGYAAPPRNEAYEFRIEVYGFSWIFTTRQEMVCSPETSI
jgi:hypothetical protein